MTTTVRRFNTDSLYTDPFFIGFDNMVSKLNNQINNSGGNYPPYNILKLGETSYVVEMAVAGFNKSDIDITLQDGTLTVEGKPFEDTESEYLHRGIAARSFKRTFTLADTIEVRGADLVNGMLQIELENIIPEEKKPRKIEISAPGDNRQFLSEYDSE
jgi:molecular chaperone IbpA